MYTNIINYMNYFVWGNTLFGLNMMHFIFELMHEVGTPFPPHTTLPPHQAGSYRPRGGGATCGHIFGGRCLPLAGTPPRGGSDFGPTDQENWYHPSGTQGTHHHPSMAHMPQNGSLTAPLGTWEHTFAYPPPGGSLSTLEKSLSHSGPGGHPDTTPWGGGGGGPSPGQVSHKAIYM